MFKMVGKGMSKKSLFTPVFQPPSSHRGSQYTRVFCFVFLYIFYSTQIQAGMLFIEYVQPVHILSTIIFIEDLFLSLNYFNIIFNCSVCLQPLLSFYIFIDLSESFTLLYIELIFAIITHTYYRGVSMR